MNIIIIVILKMLRLIVMLQGWKDILKTFSTL